MGSTICRGYWAQGWNRAALVEQDLANRPGPPFHFGLLFNPNMDRPINGGTRQGVGSTLCTVRAAADGVPSQRMPCERWNGGPAR